MKEKFIIRKAKPNEYKEIGALMVSIYSQLDGFPKPEEQPSYYKMLANIGDVVHENEVELLIAISDDNKVVGAVVFFGDMQYYGSGGSATLEKNAAGFRLLAVDSSIRKRGIGALLINECISKAKNRNVAQVIIHSTKAMKIAWDMYVKMGFVRSHDLDFKQENLSVYGFKLVI